MCTVYRIYSERGISNPGLREDPTCHEQRFFCMMKEFDALQTIGNLRQDTLKQFIGRIFIPSACVFPNYLKQVRDSQPRHDSTDTCVDHFQHVHATPSIDHADSAVCLFDDGPHPPRHQRFFKLQISKVLVLTMKSLYKLQAHGCASRVEVLNDQRYCN